MKVKDSVLEKNEARVEMSEEYAVEGWMTSDWDT